MDDAQFGKLSPKLKLAYTLGAASKVFGREQTEKQYRNIRPLVDDMYGHRRYADASENYWGGVWQVYEAE